MEITNCTFSGNWANNGGAISGPSTLIVENCILWGDESAGSKDEVNGSPAITYSDVDQEGYGGDGDPCMPDTNHNIRCNPEFRPKGDGTEGDGYFLDQEGHDKSPCIDMGDTSQNPYGGSSNTEYTTDIGGHLDMTGTAWDDEVDMGYHYTSGTYTYIQLDSFTARPVDKAILISWETGAEIDNAGFVIYRAIAGTFDYRQVSDLIAAEGSPSLGASYSFTDSSVEPGVSYNYWLIDIETTGKWTAHGPRMARLPMRVDSPMDSLERPSYTANPQMLTAR